MEKLATADNKHYRVQDVLYDGDLSVVEDDLHKRVYDGYRDLRKSFKVGHVYIIMRDESDFLQRLSSTCFAIYDGDDIWTFQPAELDFIENYLSLYYSNPNCYSVNDYISFAQL